MNAAKELIHRMIDEIPEKDLSEVIDFIGYIRKKSEWAIQSEMMEASGSSLDFWDNDVDDEVWNNL